MQCRLEYPVPKSSMTNGIPCSSSFFRNLKNNGVISTNLLSVISTQRHAGFRSFSLSNASISSASSSRSICTHETLTFILKSGTYCCSSRHIFTASPNTNLPAGMISPVSSRMGMNSIGDTNCSPASVIIVKRISASAPTIRPELQSMIG